MQHMTCENIVVKEDIFHYSVEESAVAIIWDLEPGIPGLIPSYGTAVMIECP